MTTTIHTPATLAEAEERLGDLGLLLRAKGWERAAILATFVRLPGQGYRADLPEFREVTAEQLAKKKLPGLTDPDTIRRYVKRWLVANGDVYPTPGAEVVLPMAVDWPPLDGRNGKPGASRATPTTIGKQLADNPDLAQAAAKALATDQPEVVAEAIKAKPAALTAAIVEDEHAAAVARLAVAEHDENQAAAGKPRPKPKSKVKWNRVAPEDWTAEQQREFEDEFMDAAQLIARGMAYKEAGRWKPSPHAELFLVFMPGGGEVDWDSELAKMTGGSV